MELHGLTAREKEVVGAWMQAYSVKEIALDLQLSANTVKGYLKTVYRKTRVHSARELMAKIQRAPPLATPQTDTALVLEAIEGLLDEIDADRRLETVVCRCTGARHAGRWRMAAGRPGLQLLPPAGAGEREAITGAFLLGLMEPHGIWLRAGEMAKEQVRALRRAGLKGEMIAIACGEPWAGQVLLASDPEGGEFRAFDLQALRVLAGVASLASIAAR